MSFKPKEQVKQENPYFEFIDLVYSKGTVLREEEFPEHLQKIVLTPIFSALINNLENLDILVALNETNFYELSNYQVYLFLRTTIDSKKPRGKWFKYKDEDADTVAHTEALAKYYKCSLKDARWYLDLHTQEFKDYLAIGYGFKEDPEEKKRKGKKKEKS